MSEFSWVTPPYITESQEDLYYSSTSTFPKGSPIGELNYQKPSSCFVSAFSSIPAAYHKVLDISQQERADILSSWISYIPDLTESDLLFCTAIAPVSSLYSYVDLNYTDYNNTFTEPTNLKLHSTGEISGLCNILLDNKILLIKVQTLPVPEYSPSGSYYPNTQVKYGADVFKLKSTAPFPFKPTTTFPDSIYWERIGLYTAPPAETRTFSVVLNNTAVGELVFNTPEFLGSIHIGESLGETFNIKFSVQNSNGSPVNKFVEYQVPDEFITTESNDLSQLLEGGVYKCVPYGLKVLSDGTMLGRVKYNKNVNLPTGTYEFNVVAETFSSTVIKKFTIEVQQGYNVNTVQVSCAVPRGIEREWFKIISSNAFNSVKMYRGSDPSYGLQRVPRLFIKENLYGDLRVPYGAFGQSLTNIKSYISDNVLKSPLKLKIGNTRYKTALTSEGQELYDVIYKELHLESEDISADLSALNVYTYSDAQISFSGVKDTLQDLLTSNPINVLDPRYSEDQSLSGAYTDSLPLWMTNPKQKDGFSYSSLYRISLPLAFTEPGGGAQYLLNAQQNNDYSILYNTSFEIDALIVEHICQSSGHYEVVRV